MTANKVALFINERGALPFGLWSIYAYLMQSGQEVVWITSSDNIPDDVGIVGISVISPNAKKWLEECKRITSKYPSIKIIVGGIHFSDDTVINEWIDNTNQIVIGAGEKAMLDFVTEKNTDTLVYGEALSEDQFASLPFPGKAFQDKFIRKQNPIEILYTRGCPYHCYFCKEGGTKIIRNDPESAAWYMDQLVKWYGNKRIFIYDDILTLNKGWLRAFVKALKLRPRFRCFIHPKTTDEESFDLLYRAGAYQFSVGVESGNNEMLKRINKGTQVKDYVHLWEQFKQSKIRACFHTLYMVGNIGETKQSMQDTVDVSKQIGNTRPGVSYATPFPGTKFYTVCKKYGTLLEPDVEKWKWKNIVYIPNDITKEQMINYFNLARNVRKEFEPPKFKEA